ncbi:hypothetical protein [Maritalea porphyrae]|uniref:hypothetical protein n=1 Tax=Maritalea porphyrae TaxID=880732 RepID=UPI0022B047C9|nr:hypothetical protein [Maritalea porphyrae]MCZ4271597.1 hypothetical protein [Maritalea porphyrae]
MKLEQIALILVIIATIGNFGVMVFGIVSSGVPIWPFFILAIVGLALLGRVIYQRTTNEEDNYYEKNIKE